MDHEQSAAITDAEQSAPDPEVVDGVVVIANVRALAGVREGPPPFVQVAAVAATGFMAGAATAEDRGRFLTRRASRAPASRVRGRRVAAPSASRERVHVDEEALRRDDLEPGKLARGTPVE
jgi:hypothetical protein